MVDKDNLVRYLRVEDKSLKKSNNSAEKAGGGGVVKGANLVSGGAVVAGEDEGSTADFID